MIFFFQQAEVEPYLDKNIWNTLASNIPVDSMGYSKDMLPDSRYTWRWLWLVCQAVKGIIL